MFVVSNLFHPFFTAASLPPDDYWEQRAVGNGGSKQTIAARVIRMR